MLAQPATKVFFKTSEPRAAKWISDAIRRPAQIMELGFGHACPLYKPPRMKCGNP